MRTEELASEALAKTRKEMEEDQKIAEEFRRRKVVKELHRDLVSRDQYIENPMERQDIRNRQMKTEAEIDFFNTDDTMSNLLARRTEKEKKRIEEISAWSDFTLMFLDADFMTNVTKLKRVSHRRVLLYLGNGKGVIGYGKGIGEDYQSAYANALENAKKNMIIIHRDAFNTWPQYVRTRFNDVRLTIYPHRGGNYWGSPIMWMMIYLCGIYHCSFSIIARKPSPYALVYAFFVAVTMNKTQKEIVETSGDKLYLYNMAVPTLSQSSGIA